MVGGNRKTGNTGQSSKKRANGNENDYDDSFSPMTMSQIGAVVSKNDKAMQVLIENYRRSGTNTPLWLSTTPYYKKDSMLVVNLRDERTVVSFANEPIVEGERPSKKKNDSEKPKSQPNTPVIQQGVKERVSTFPTPATVSTQSGKSFAVSGGDAASRLGLRIGSAAEAQVPSTKSSQQISVKGGKKESPPTKQPEMAFVGNVKNLGLGWDSKGFDNMLLGGNAAPDPLAITSDPIWGTDTSESNTSDYELHNMLSMLRDLAPVNLESGEPTLPQASASAMKITEPKTSQLASSFHTANDTGSPSITQMSSPITVSQTGSQPSATSAPASGAGVTLASPMMMQQHATQHGVPSHNGGAAQQYYYFMSPQGIPMMTQMPAVPNQMQYIQQIQQMQMQQMMAMNPTQQYLAQAQGAAQGQGALGAQQRAMGSIPPQLFYQSNLQMAHQQLAKQQAAAAAAQQQSILAAQQAALQQQQRQQQLASLAAQQLLSKGSTAALPQMSSPPTSGNSSKSTAEVAVEGKGPNPNARPFQPPASGEKRFNIEATPFVPPSGR